MAVLAISDLMLFVTLLVNAGAVLSFKLPASMCATTNGTYALVDTTMLTEFPPH
eukprot:SAG31_NODE_1743_length_7383_cov_21.902389_3_plen_54_part_00